MADRHAVTPADLAAEVARLLALVAELTHPYEDQGAVSNLVGCGHIHRSPTGRAFRCAEPPDAAVHQVPGMVQGEARPTP